MAPVISGVRHISFCPVNGGSHTSPTNSHAKRDLGPAETLLTGQITWFHFPVSYTSFVQYSDSVQ